jgi:hypothetical protein
VDALASNTTAGANTANGAFALFSNTTGSGNTAVGTSALQDNTTGGGNTAIGTSALNSNTEGEANTANGAGALVNNTTASGNTASGYQALNSNTSGISNTASGAFALLSNTTAGGNTATGYEALHSNTTANANTANGYHALFSNTTGVGNTANGWQALRDNTTGNSNIALGVNAGLAVSTANGVICIGANGLNVDNSCFIGNIFNATSSGGTAVFINSDGRLGTTTSSRRFKEDIKSMDRASEALFALKPVTFRYKKGIDPQGIPQFGLVAEEVEAVDPDLVVRDKEGKVNTVRYEAINAMVLNEFLKAHAKLQQQQATIEKQQKQIQALTTGLQKVSDQLELKMPSLRTADNH